MNKPYLAVDLMTGESLGRYGSYGEAARATQSYAVVDIQYRPRSSRTR